MLDGDPVGTQLTTAATPYFRHMPIVAKRSPISATAELLFFHMPGLGSNYCLSVYKDLMRNVPTA